MAGMKCPRCTKRRQESVQDVFAEFCEKTATRGLPRAVREPSKAWALVWYLAVLLLFVFATSQICLLVLQYSSYAVIQRESTQPKGHYPFPSVTVCNLSPVSFNFNATTEGVQPHLQSLKDFYKYIDSLQAKNPSMTKYLNMLRSSEGFFHNIQKTKHHLYGYSAEHLINSCLVRTSTGFSSFVTKDCTEIKITQSPLFFNCFTIDMPAADSKHAMTLSLILYLDENTELLDVNSQREDIFGHSLGVKVTVHEAGTFPDIGHSNTKIGPGVSSWIALGAKEWHKLGQPFEPCVDAEIKRIWVDNAGSRLNYSRSGCIMACLQHLLAKECGCLNPSWPMTKKQLNQFPYCLNISDNLPDLKRRVDCRQGVENFEERCDKLCLSKCKHYVFGQQVSSSAWPLVANQLAFYKSYIAPRSYSNRFSIYKELLREAKLAMDNGTQEMLYQKLYGIDLINRNFLQINVHRDFELRVIEEQPAYGMQQLLSSIGGIFSLTIGITLITVVELVELFYRIFLFVCDRQRWRKTSTRAAVVLCDCTDSQLASDYGSFREMNGDNKSPKLPLTDAVDGKP